MKTEIEKLEQKQRKIHSWFEGMFALILAYMLFTGYFFEFLSPSEINICLTALLITFLILSLIEDSFGIRRIAIIYIFALLIGYKLGFPHPPYLINLILFSMILAPLPIFGIIELFLGLKIYKLEKMKTEPGEKKHYFYNNENGHTTHYSQNGNLPSNEDHFVETF